MMANGQMTKKKVLVFLNGEVGIYTKAILKTTLRMEKEYFVIINKVILSKKYDGEWANDKQEGFGVFEWRNGQRYEGYFKNNFKNRKGIFYYNGTSNIEKYDGEQVNDQQEGFGVQEMRNCDTYEGYFENSKRNEKGILYFNEYSKCEQSKWIDNRKEGFGVFQWRDGDRQEGYNKNNEKHGKGTMYLNYRIKKKCWNGKYQRPNCQCNIF
ncbi:hypothetical protein ABPG72_017763 [Tetrahymena utriculariae]